MTSNDDQTRIYIDWQRARPVTLRGWLAVLGAMILTVCVIVLVAAIASTLLVIALIIATLSAGWWMVQRLFRGRSDDRTIIIYRNDNDA
jgi:Flp pilus assembly protein TadB